MRTLAARRYRAREVLSESDEAQKKVGPARGKRSQVDVKVQRSGNLAPQKREPSERKPLIEGGAESDEFGDEGIEDGNNTDSEEDSNSDEDGENQGDVDELDSGLLARRNPKAYQKQIKSEVSGHSVLTRMTSNMSF